MKTEIALDIECYKNFFCVVCRNVKSGRTFSIQMLNNVRNAKDDQILNAVLSKHRIITFNGTGYDVPVLSAYLQGWKNEELKELSDAIIVENIPRWQMVDVFPELRIKSLDHIDLMGVTPLKASLKTYGCRIHSPKLQDLPIHPDATISAEQADVLMRYCENDVLVTIDILNTMRDQITLREQMGNEYGMDMRSMSDPQIAEAAIRYELEKNKIEVIKRPSKVKPFEYMMPAFITFKTPELKALRTKVGSVKFNVDHNGYAQLPKELDQSVLVNGRLYKMGIGGLHSQEKKQVVCANQTQLLGEFDVASMYPSIILGQGLYPKHLGEGFSNVYRSIFEQRIHAKRTGNKTTADTLKIVLNSSYGKFGSKYSYLYSPELLVQTTITGQLSLLMLIERLGEVCEVVSANTDGVVCLIEEDKWDIASSICQKWSQDTTYQLEWTPYQAIYSRDVNSYVAIKADSDEVKTKGAYEYGSIRKGYDAEVCIDAVIGYLRDGVPVEETIRSCDDVTKFMTMRGVRGGAVWRNQQLGKVVRWYKSTEGEPIRYRTNGNKVATSDGAVPLMDLPLTLPEDIDYEAYCTKSRKMITDLGVEYVGKADRKGRVQVRRDAGLAGV